MMDQTHKNPREKVWSIQDQIVLGIFFPGFVPSQIIVCDIHTMIEIEGTGIYQVEEVLIFCIIRH